MSFPEAIRRMDEQYEEMKRRQEAARQAEADYWTTPTQKAVRVAISAYDQLWNLSDEWEDRRNTDNDFDNAVFDWRDYAKQYIDEHAIEWLRELAY